MRYAGSAIERAAAAVKDALLRQRIRRLLLCALPLRERAALNAQQIRSGEGFYTPPHPIRCVELRGSLSQHKGVYARLRGRWGERASTSAAALGHAASPFPTQ